MATRDPNALSWEKLEQALLDAAVRGEKASAEQSPLTEMFEPAELADLKRLAAQTRLYRAHSAPLGNVVFLHGITGADLGVAKANGKTDTIWIHTLRLIGGRIADLVLNDDATKDKPGFKVRAIGANKKYYAKAVLSLRARWNVESYAYDWRRDVDEASDGLAELIRSRFPDRPVHLVAHSMGGLVARNFILRHPALWESMRDAELVSGGRLVMLGTPNYGSFAIAPVLSGNDQLMELLERLDLAHNMPALLGITNTFVGTYMLLPSPSKLSPALLRLYQRETWGNVPGISQRHLDRTYKFHKDLENGSTVDPARMCYVAGCRFVTIDAMSIVAAGEFEYRLGYRGDGRVPHELGLLPGVPTFYVEEVHGDLARNEQVLRAVDQLLQTGSTDELVTTVLRARSAIEPRMREYRTPAERRLMAELDRVASKASTEGVESLSQQDRRIAADALIQAALGTNSRNFPRPGDAPDAASARSPRAGSVAPVPLRVGVRFGDVTKVKAPLVVVGHYRGVEPVNAIGAIDAAMSGWIARAVKRGMISGQLGETFYVPARGALAADGVVVAGMGDYGQFGPTALRRLMANVAIGAAALGLASIATVLIGAGEGSLDQDVALKELLEGVGAGLAEMRDEMAQDMRLHELVLIEHNPARFAMLHAKLKWMADNGALANVRLQVIPSLPGDRARARKAEMQARVPARTPRRGVAPEGVREFEEVRIAVERDESRSLLRFSALTKNAVVPVREVAVDLRNAREAAAALRNAATPEEQARYGRLLYTYLMPQDFHELMDGTVPVRLIVDSTTAAYPWEMACFVARDESTQLRWLGTDLGLSRQFKTLLSAAPGGFTPPLNNRLRVLVIADPAPELELRLPGARTEGRRIVEALKRMSGQTVGSAKIDVEVEHRIGPGECDPIEILALLLSGDYDIVHFSGHGDYDAGNPKSSGWVFGADRILTATDFFRARKVPRLVFANACFSGVLRESQRPDGPDLSRGVASVAEAFLERGVPNYIGTGWPVDDQQAVKTAQVFYDGMLQQQTLGRALQQARTAVFREQFGSSWGAYQLYGNPGDTLLRPSRHN